MEPLPADEFMYPIWLLDVKLLPDSRFGLWGSRGSWEDPELRPSRVAAKGKVDFKNNIGWGGWTELGPCVVEEGGAPALELGGVSSS
jgi:hypothetical protein